MMFARLLQARFTAWSKLGMQLAAAILFTFALLPLEVVKADLTLIDNHQSKCVIVAPAASMSWPGDDKTLNRWNPYSEEPERRRRLLRDSINDLAFYLQKMTNAKVQIVDALPANDKRIPIYIHSAAEKIFGPVGIDKAKLFGFRVIANDQAIGLYGQSEYGTSYAIYELLHELGCRWFLPSEMGEVVPTTSQIVLKTMDRKLAPATLWRRMETRVSDNDFRRRNRIGGSNEGGLIVMANHALEGYITKEQREAHPEWCLHIDGKPHPSLLRWTRQDVADAIADKIIENLDKNYTDTVSLSPGDYVVPTEDPEERKADPNPRIWEPAANKWSVTDRLILLANRIATRVGKKYPDVRFGLLAYVNYNMAPAVQKIHPNVIPMIAPIDFNRQHPMTWKNHPNQFWLLDIVKSWAAKTPHLAYYAYGMNLAELTAPNPFITKWGTNIPILLKNHVIYWAPETMGGWESMMPGYYLAIRMTFDPTEKPQDILDDMMTRLYGHAAKPMNNYWHDIDRAWIDSNQYAGSAFAYLKIFTPQVLAKVREDIDQALAACKTIDEYRRVQMINQSLSTFELFMKMRRDFASANFRTIDKDLDAWRGSIAFLAREYKQQYAFDSGLSVSYINSQFAPAYEDAARVAKAYRLVSQPLLKWKYKYDNDKVAMEQGWTRPNHDDSQWPVTQIVEDTWSSLGHHNDMGRMVYRTVKPVAIRKPPANKRVYLWIGSTDGSAQVFINGKPVPYVMPKDTRMHKQGEVLEAFNGYCQPAMFDVTDFLTDSPVQISIVCERTWLNELGTGGLMGPVMLYQEK